MDLKETLISLFEPSGSGLETWPNYSPLLPKKDGYNVETFDDADANTVRLKYNDNASLIEEVN